LRDGLRWQDRLGGKIIGAGRLRDNPLHGRHHSGLDEGDLGSRLGLDPGPAACGRTSPARAGGPPSGPPGFRDNLHGVPGPGSRPLHWRGTRETLLPLASRPGRL